MTKGAAADWAAIVEAFASDKAVSIGEGRGFGSGALKVDGKIFALQSSRGALVVKLPKARADELFATGEATPFDPGHGPKMKQWAAIESRAADWLALVKEARAYVARAG